jgi:Lrp/AsnC family leucine-responsive transcriptional regulator
MDALSALLSRLSTRATEKTEAMDKFDREIISALWKNARTSYKDLGELVSLSPNAVSERIRRLEESGVIQKYEVKVDLRAMGMPLAAIIDVKLSPHTTAVKFEAELQRISGILEATLMTGAFDYMLRVACRDQEALVRLTEELRAGGWCRRRIRGCRYGR